LSAFSNEEQSFLHALYKADATNLEPIISLVSGTCTWFFNNPVFTNWLKSKESQVLYFTANPSCGKSVICKSVFDHLSPHQLDQHSASNDLVVCNDLVVLSFFFKSGIEDCNNAIAAICTVLHQLLSGRLELMQHAIGMWLTHWSTKGMAAAKDFQTLWQIFVNVVQADESLQVV
jgi:hypothetical protein